MDLESGSSTLESVENNGVITPQRLANVDGNEIANNGSCGGEFNGYDDHSLVNSKPKDIRVVESSSSPRSNGNSALLTGNSLSVGSSPQAAKKGYGLKKWRRIRREFSNDGSGNVDTSKILKRGLSTSMVNSSKPQGVSIETRQKSDGSSSSTNAILKSVDVADGSALHGSSLNSRSVGPSFAAGTDSDNSEDRSSKSSTAASVPKNRMRTLSGKNLVNSVQRSQHGKSQIETGKKHRGVRVKIEKENSNSSMESDSRSSKFVFKQGTTSLTSNGRHSGRSMKYDGANGHEAQDGERHLDEELQPGYDKENVGEFETLSQEDLAADLSSEVGEEKVENHRESTDRDPLVESINTLQSAQEELEKEVQKLREIGTEHGSLFDGSTGGTTLPSEFTFVDSSINKARACDLLRSGGITQNSSEFVETQVVSLKQNINLLERKLEETNTELKAKEAKVIELEFALKRNESPKGKVESQHKNYIELEAELEDLFKLKFEAEVEYLAISRTIQNLRVAAVDHFALFEKQKTLALEQARVLNELGDVESKAAKLKTQAEKLETKYEDVAVTEEILKLQNGVCQVTSCLLMQLILLVVVCVFFLLQLSPPYEGVVPT